MVLFGGCGDLIRRRGRLKVEIINRQKGRIPRQMLNRWVDGVWRELKKIRTLPPARVVTNAKTLRLISKAKTLRLIFVTKAEGRKINKQFRGKDYATDILSFDPMEPGEPGELVLCLPVIKKQAKDHDQTELEELQYMVLHGILHLLGYDHEKSDKEARRMYRLQDDIFEKLSVK